MRAAGLERFRADSLNAPGMRGAYGKPYGLSARVKINQVMFSIRTTLKGEEHACEALRKVSRTHRATHARSSTIEHFLVLLARACDRDKQTLSPRL